jgi:hypothetical protein
MTPKEKAKQLLESMTFSCRECDNAKLSALIAVDEIISGYEFDSLDIEHKRIIDNINFWDKVKQEIEKL